MDTDQRWYVTGFEVHYWDTGRILMVHLTGMGSAPLVTEVVATDSDAGTVTLGITTMLVAQALAQFADPTGVVIRHRADGQMAVISYPSMAETVIRPAVA